MIPEELERQVWQVKKEVRGGRRGRERKRLCVWALGEHAGPAARPTSECVGERRGPLRIKGGSSFTDVLFPGACSTRSAEFLRCSHSQMAGAY